MFIKNNNKNIRSSFSNTNINKACAGLRQNVKSEIKYTVNIEKLLNNLKLVSYQKDKTAVEEPQINLIYNYCNKIKRLHFISQVKNNFKHCKTNVDSSVEQKTVSSDTDETYIDYNEYNNSNELENYYHYINSMHEYYEDC